MAKESSSPCCVPVLFLQQAWWITFPRDPCSLSIRLRKWQVQPGAVMVCPQHQPTEKEKAKESQNKKQLWHCSVQVKTQWLPMKGQCPLPMGAFSLK